jgi:subtilase family serine protease
VQANGTSLASPAICGLAALVDQHFTNATGVRASAYMKMAAIVNSATFAAGLVDGYGAPVVGYSDLSFGVPDLNFAIATYYDKLVTSGGSVTKCFAATSTQVSITMAYADLPAMAFVSNVMVNVLGMAVIYNGVSNVPAMTQNVQKITLSVLLGATIDVSVRRSPPQTDATGVRRGPALVAEPDLCARADQRGAPRLRHPPLHRVARLGAAAQQRLPGGQLRPQLRHRR